MKTITVGALTEKRLKSGIQLLDEKDFSQEIAEDGLVSIYSQSGRFLGTGYLSKQNKGVGWFLSDKKIILTQSYYKVLFEQARVKRQQFEQSSLTTAYRLFNQDGDGLGGLTVDRYGDYALFSWYNTFLYHQKETIIAAFQEVFPELLGGYEKIRFKGTDVESAHVYGQEAPDTFTILENGVRYSVFLNDGLMTGIFLDQHEVRDVLINGLALGKTVLNLFSYTAAFSVAAAMGGAVETTSVDLAKRSRLLSQAHFEANGLETGSHHFVVMDVFEYFRYAKRHGLTFDVIVIDPPSFARNKKMTFSVAKDYYRLIAEAVELLSSKGTIIASTNAANVSLSQFYKQLRKGLGSANYHFTDLKQLPSDFVVNEKDESSNYLKVVTIQVN